MLAGAPVPQHISALPPHHRSPGEGIRGLGWSGRRRHRSICAVSSSTSRGRIAILGPESHPALFVAHRVAETPLEDQREDTVPRNATDHPVLHAMTIFDARRKATATATAASAAIAVAIFGVSARAQAAGPIPPPTTAPAFVPLGDLPGGTFFSLALNVSSDGLAVTGYADADGGTLPFRWTADTGIVAIAGPDIGPPGYGIGASCEGTIFAASATTSAGTEVVAWTPVSGLVVLGDLPGGPVDAQVGDMSADGRTIVGMSGSFPDPTQIFRWTFDGGFEEIDLLPGGPPVPSGAIGGCNGDGTVIVGQSTSSEGLQAIRWTEATGTVGLGDIPGGGFSSQAISPSNDGSVIVGYGESVAGFEAMRWTESGGMVGLGDLPGGTYSSQANDVSGDGSTVVGFGADGSGFPTTAIIWTEANGLRDLRQVLIDDHGLGAVLADWHLLGATAISSDGGAIVGWAQNPDGATEAFLARLTPPDPADLDGDGFVNLADLLQLLAAWDV